MTPARFTKICAVLDRRQPDLTVIADEVHKGRNLSAIIRTCDAVGIQTFHCVYPRAGFRAFRGTALGSHKWVDTIVHSSVAEGINNLKAKGHRIVAANLSQHAVDYRSLDYTQPTALLLGTEKQGVSDAGLAMSDEEISIPMLGMVESFNVSAACAIILAEVQSQREAAGMYAKRRIDDTQHRQLLFRWCQPVVAQYCDERGLEYPEIDSEGHLIKPSDWYQNVRGLGVEEVEQT